MCAQSKNEPNLCSLRYWRVLAARVFDCVKEADIVLSEHATVKN